MAVIFELIKNGNSLIDSGLFTQKDKHAALAFLTKADRSFQVLFWREEQEVPTTILDLMNEREERRKQKNWAEADKIRNKMNELGWQIEDTESGPKPKKM